MKSKLILISLILVGCTNSKLDKQTDVTRDTFLYDSAAAPQKLDTFVNQPKVIEVAPSEPLQKEVVNVRIQNTYIGSDKTMSCTAEIEDGTKVMTLRSLQHTDVFQLKHEGNTVYQLMFYDGDELQASKIVYRREDLETSTDEQIYSSRTGEITFTISY